MQKIAEKIIAIASSSFFLGFGKAMMIFGLFFLSRTVFAGTSDDLLLNTTSQALSTINGTGRNWAYIIDGAISLGAFAKTKNPFVFFSVLAVALGITVIYKMAGGT